ncbi:phage tail protein I [Clostridium chromiireducens]|uniref:Phage tail protein I n=1 Tax=Clostridium chromiireducens TaxID=225345 RepID=A0A399IKQ9_9CLOT|nr:phage tail protein I [Clostridium chromiireducens]RII32859.1 phage tail protein I [Clostridium chromiireducens]
MVVKNIDLLSLQTAQMQQDPTTKAICAALNSKFQELGEEVKTCLIYSRIDYLSEDILDELAYQMHADWYDMSANIDIKKNLIKNALKVHRYRGTPYAVEQVVQDYFGDGTIEEWFEYGGNPYMFRVVTTNTSVTSELANQFTMAVNSVKNMRSHLEQIIIDISGKIDSYFASVIQICDEITIEQEV